MFVRPIRFAHGGGISDRRIDLYRRGTFVRESRKLKAGSHIRGFDDALLRALQPGGELRPCAAFR